MDKLEDMKEMWIELNNRVTSLEEDNRRLARQVMNNDYKSTKEKLVKRYNFFIVIELIMSIAMSFFILNNPLADNRYRIVTFIYWLVFFLGEASVDTYLMLKVKNIDIYNSSVTEISNAAANSWKIHKFAIVIGLPFAFGAIILFALLLKANTFTILGMIVGGIVGALIGMRELKKFIRDYKILQSNER